MSDTRSHVTLTDRLGFTRLLVIGSAVVGLAMLVISGVSWWSALLLVLIVSAQGFAGAAVWHAVIDLPRPVIEAVPAQCNLHACSA